MSDKKKIGALWKKTTQTGKTLLTGNVEINGEKIKMAVFENTYKQEEYQPTPARKVRCPKSLPLARPKQAGGRHKESNRYSQTSRNPLIHSQNMGCLDLPRPSGVAVDGGQTISQG